MKPLVIATALALFSGIHAAEITVTKAHLVSGDKAPVSHFTGNVVVERVLGPELSAQISGGLVTFDAGARTHWHSHPAEQTLMVTSGIGRVQAWGGSILEIRQGDIVRIPANTKHWHGAGPATAMSHFAIAQKVDGHAVQWLEAVDDSQYDQAPLVVQTAEATSGPSRAQQLVGSVAPKLAELTDTVLFGDVWARPQLCRRDRSLITISALIAMNRPEQLRTHLALGKQNGLTEEELSEAITHLAFYAGWPSAMTAAGVAKDVFKK